MKPTFIASDECKLEWCDGFGAWHVSPAVGKFFDGGTEYIVIKCHDGSFRVINFQTGETHS